MSDFKTYADTITDREYVAREVERLFVSGQPKKAQRKANEFNSRVDEKLKPFYDEYDDWSDELAEEHNPEVYINISNLRKI